MTVLGAIAAMAAACVVPPEPASLVIRGGLILTMERDRPRGEALAVRGDRIVAVGSDREIERYVGPKTEVIDLAGRVALPGFIESHGHLLNLGEVRLNVDLSRTRNWDEIVARVREAASKAAPGTWILGRGWHQSKWDRPAEPSVEGYPLHDALSAVSTANPVLLKHASGHAAIVNAAALVACGIDARTADPPGGRILRDRSGRPTGVLLENAYEDAVEVHRRAIESAPAEVVEGYRRRRIEVAAAECLSKGITTFVDAGETFEVLDLYRRLAESGRLPIRIHAMILEDPHDLAERLSEHRWIGLGGDRLTVRMIKQQIDGALGSRGAWLLAPYDDLPGSVGIETTPIPTLEGVARLAIEQDFQLCIHAIGDRANREVLDLYARTFRAHPDKTGLRWRIEHAQHLDPSDVPRFARLGVVASVQGVHCTSDGPWVPDRIGETRAREGAYVWRDLLDSGAVVVNGTDCPVEDPDPIANLAASVTRRMGNGRVFHPRQRMTREEALASYTRDAAWALFEEEHLGTLAVGKLADIVVLSGDPLSVPEDELSGLRVVGTVSGGKIAFHAP